MNSWRELGFAKCRTTIRHFLIPIWLIAIWVKVSLKAKHLFNLNLKSFFFDTFEAAAQVPAFRLLSLKGAGAQLDKSTPSYCLHIRYHLLPLHLIFHTTTLCNVSHFPVKVRSSRKDVANHSPPTPPPRLSFCCPCWEAPGLSSLCLHKVIIPFKVIDLVLMCIGINIYQLSLLTMTHHLYFYII